MIALVGGAEFLPAAAELDKALIEIGGSTVHLLATAASRQRPELAVATATAHFTSLGVRTVEVPVYDRQSASSDDNLAMINEANFVYVAGGDPGVLLNTLKQTPLADALEGVATRGVLAGSSAGAMVMCSDMFDPGSRTNMAALGIVENLLVVPHFERFADKWLGVTKEVDARILGIDESTGVLMEDSTCRVIGPGRASLIEKGQTVWEARGPAEIGDCL